MSAKPHVRRAQGAVEPLRRRLLSLQSQIDLDSAIDVDSVASIVCDCEIVRLSRLSEARMIAALERDYGVDVNGASARTDAPLAGALCVAENGYFRWIFVSDEDSPARQRFTIAHELGHLFLEAIPELEQRAAAVEPEVEFAPSSVELRLFGRCQETEPTIDASTRSSSAALLSRADLHEIHAHHFAAELLMPYEGVKRLVARRCGSHGVQTRDDLDRLIVALAEQYSVSNRAARLRLEKDLAIVPRDSDPNQDLFG